MEIVLKYTLKNVKVTYEKETTYGETVNVFTEVINEDNIVVCLHKIMDKQGKELTLLIRTWRSKCTINNC